MRVFTDPKDRYFVGKLCAGLIAFFNIHRLLLALNVYPGIYLPKEGLFGGDPSEVAIRSALYIAGSLLAFRLIERARRRSQDGGPNAQGTA